MTEYFSTGIAGASFSSTLQRFLLSANDKKVTNFLEASPMLVAFISSSDLRAPWMGCQRDFRVSKMNAKHELRE
jgi:hypothetical protein